MNYKHRNDSAAWILCAPGTLLTLTGQLRTANRQRALQRVTTALLLFLAIGVGSWTASRAILQTEPFFGGISCRDVQTSLKLYSEGRLPEPLSEKMAAHLRECPRCQELLRAMNQQPSDEVHTTPQGGYTLLASM